MKKLLACLAFLSTAASATPPPIMPLGPQSAPSPRLLVMISVDQLSADLFEAYRQQFTAGLARMQLGTTFLNGYQSHAASETCPGHSTIVTGARPARTGVIANNWIDQAAAREDKTIYCAEDERVAGSTSRKYTVSPEHLRVTTLGDQLKAAVPAARNFAVAGKDRAAVMMGGRNVDQRWYWDGNRFSTDRKGAAEPRTVTALNAALEPRIAAPAAALELPALCQGKARPYTVAAGVAVGAGRLERAAGDKSGFRASPDFDGAALALAAGLIQEFRLGRGQAATDIISIGLSGTDYVGHSFGTGGSEMCLQLLGLDRELGSFFSLLDQTRVDYAVVLTADHGAMDIPERLRDQGISQAARADTTLIAANVGKAIGARLGLSGPVILGEGTSGDFWIDRSLNVRNRARALAAAVQFYRAHPQVAAVFTSRELTAAPKPVGHVRNWSLKARARASFDPARSGDFVVLLKEYVSPIAEPARGYVAGHGTPWDYDRRVPILFWRRGTPPAVSGEHIETVDIMPTAAALIGLLIDGLSIDGQCLLGVLGVVCPPR